MGAPRFAISDKLVEQLSAADRKSLGLHTRSEINQNLSDKAEREIQSEVEAYLRINGFWPRSPAFLDGKIPKSGWYIHLHETRTNPILLDLMICTLDGHCLELELKKSAGGIRDAQNVILKTTACARLARSTGEAVDYIREWMESLTAAKRGAA